MSKSVEESKIRVLIVDDHFMARIGLAVPLNQEDDLCVVAEARTGQEALEFYREHRPDVVTMDYRLPDEDGPETSARIVADFPDARILLLSAFAGEEQVFRAVEAGVSGYLTKDAAFTEVADAIRMIHKGGTVFSNEILARVEARRQRPSLTPRELVIVQYVAQGFTNKEIAARMSYSESLIKQELVRAFGKLGALDRAHATALAIERGLVEIARP